MRQWKGGEPRANNGDKPLQLCFQLKDHGDGFLRGTGNVEHETVSDMSIKQCWRAASASSFRHQTSFYRRQCLAANEQDIDPVLHTVNVP